MKPVRLIDGLIAMLATVLVVSFAVICFAYPYPAFYSMFSRIGAIVVLCGAAFEFRRVLYDIQANRLNTMRLVKSVLTASQERLETVELVALLDRRIDLIHSHAMLLDKAIRGKNTEQALRQLKSALDEKEAYLFDPDEISKENERLRRRVEQPAELPYSKLDRHHSWFGIGMIVVGTLIWSFGDWIAELLVTGKLSAFESIVT